MRTPDAQGTPGTPGTPGQEPVSSATSLPADTDPIFAQLWTANQAAFDGRDYETACHTLQAALARAYFLQDTAQVTAVQQRAAAQHDSLVQQAPQESQTLPSHVHPARWDAILLVYGNIVQEARSLLDLLRPTPSGSLPASRR